MTGRSEVVRVQNAVLISGHAASLLASAVQALRAAQAGRGRRLTRELVAVLADLEAATNTPPAKGPHAVAASTGAPISTGVRLSPGDPHRPLCTDEVAAVLGCSAQSVRERARRGTLPGHRTGGRWVFDRGALEVHRGR